MKYGKYWTEEKVKSMKVDQAKEELKSILKDYHYDSKEQHISKDVVTALENLVGALKWNIVKGRGAIPMKQKTGFVELKATRLIKLEEELVFII
mgnify:CR=1 FL=1